MYMDRDNASSSTQTREFVPYVENNLNYVQKSPSLSPTRIYSSPLMGKSARAAKRRLDGDTTRPTRIEGIDTYNQPSQNFYQNVGNNLENQKPLNSTSNEPGQESFSAKRDFFEQRFKTSAPTYDSPPRDQQQLSPQIVTTITTTTTSTPSKLVSRTSLPSNESLPTINRLLEQATEIQKRTTDNSSNQNASQQSLVIERTEQCQVYLDRTNHDQRHTSPASVRKTNLVTDLDQAQAQVNRLTDDHQAIQQLTRVLQENQVSSPTTTPPPPPPPQPSTTTNQSQRLSSAPGNPVLINTTTTTTTTIPTDITLVNRNNKTVASEFTVIDALLDNPIGTTNSKQNDTLHTRFNNIISNLQNSDYMSILRQSLTRKSKRKNSKQDQNQLSQTSTNAASEQTSLIDSKQNKKNKKKNKNKSKTTPYTNYEVIDAIINSPIILRLPESFLRKYNVRPPASQLSPTPPLTTRNNNILSHKQLDNRATNDTDRNLVNERRLHHTPTSTPTFPTNLNDLQQTNRSNYQQSPVRSYNQSGAPIKPRIIYRYIDERGNVLKYSSVPPSQLREVPSKQSPPSPYQNVEPKYFNSRQIIRDDHHSKPERRTWQDHKGYSSTRRDDLDYQDKRRSQLSERSLPIARAIPVTVEREQTRRAPSLQQRPYQSPNQQNIKLSWLPLTPQFDQPHIGGAAVDYETDSTGSDHSITYPTYEYKPNDSHNNRPLFRHDYYQNRSPSLTFNQSPTRSSHDYRNQSPDYSLANISRNYIEVFRDGAANPSEIYSVPLSEPRRRKLRHSRYDKHQAEKSGKISNSSISKHNKAMPSSSSPSNHDSFYSHTTHGSPNHDSVQFDNYLPQSKSFDYRPLRMKLQREHKITPSLLVDEWDHPDEIIPTPSYKTTSVSSPDDVFLKNTHKSNNHANGHIEQQQWFSRHDVSNGNQQKTQTKPSIQLNSQPIYKALALHSFYAQTSRELSFKKGDILLVWRRINDDWLEGEFQDIIGIFPLNHVELFPLEKNEQENMSSDYDTEYEPDGEAIVKYDFIPQKTFELQLRKGDKVTLLRRLDENWYEGRLNHIEGIFPAAYVETLREPPDNLLKNPQVIEQIQSPKQVPPDSEPISSEKGNPIPNVSLPMRKCQVLYDYTPQNPDELEIHVGDIINIIEMCDDGWYCGVMDKPSQRDSMEFGTFPGNYVKLLS
ncbi:hypothetical protein I4U23_020798 [Adineta vaga]|nr:hypothetical protein I4U23_020798 [Adineta vaga]